MLARRIRFRRGTCLNSSDSDLKNCRGPSGLFSCIHVSGSTGTQIRGHTQRVSGGRNRGHGGGFGACDGVELVDLVPHL
jgi:hypothetical protein